jgi:hypothetical protein
MRRFALSMLCVTPTLLVSACGDNLRPDDEIVDDDVTMESDPPDQEVPGPTRQLTASVDIFSPSCDKATAAFEVLARYMDDTVSLRNIGCRITFDDGAVSDRCVGEHTFASAGAHTFVAEVVDLDTGATTRVETKRNIAVPLEVDLTLDVPECGLALDFDASISTSAEVHVTMSPADKVIEPHVFGRTGGFEVREPGTYTILVSAEDERTTGPICLRTVSRTVELRACHDHEPGCGH